jgi:hypothetical protein
MGRFSRKNPFSRNFGLGSRSLDVAGLHALREGMRSHSSIATMADRWKIFANFCRKELKISDMRRIGIGHIRSYSDHLLHRLDADEISPATAQNYLSAVNRVLEIARGDRVVRLDPVHDAGLPRRSGVATENHAMEPNDHQRWLASVPPLLAAAMMLQREFGLRFEESVKIDAKKALNEAMCSGVVRVSDGTKGGRSRLVPAGSEQIAALQRAAELQGSHWSLIPPDQSYAVYREACYRYGIRFHSERHAYAQARYLALTGASCPVAAGVAHGAPHHRYLAAALGLPHPEAKALDSRVRLQIAAELGHGRVCITNAYLG